MKRIFKQLENWYGGGYELAIELTKEDNSQGIQKALNLIWGSPQLEGPYLRNDIEPDMQEKPLRISPTTDYFGVLNFDSGIQLCCGTRSINEDPDSEETATDWVIFFAPGGVVSEKFGVNDEIDNIANPLLEPMVEFFKGLAIKVFKSIEYRLAIIGHEASGLVHSDTISVSDLDSYNEGFIFPKNTIFSEYPRMKPLSDELVWCPPRIEETGVSPN